MPSLLFLTQILTVWFAAQEMMTESNPEFNGGTYSST
jgi:hypothetical protein